EEHWHRCWGILSDSVSVPADVWRQTGDESQGCVIILLFDMQSPFSGVWTASELERKVLRLLGTPLSRGGRRPVALRDATFFFEVIPAAGRQSWMEERQGLLSTFERVEALSVIDPERERGRSGRSS
ncbi:hypothetical protein BHE90_017733, partial [Fusarium euwallaceae]